jgi:hypothetical protein
MKALLGPNTLALRETAKAVGAEKGRFRTTGMGSAQYESASRAEGVLQRGCIELLKSVARPVTGVPHLRAEEWQIALNGVNSAAPWFCGCSERLVRLAALQN